MTSSRHLVLVGATASGKSDIAVTLAEKATPPAEIISLDSMQIYKGMEIGTGVVPVGERKGIVHHMISMIEPTIDHSVKQFQQQVYDLIETHSENRYVLVGGTGLYTHAIVDGFSFAPTDILGRAAVIEKYGLDEDNPDLDKVASAYQVLREIDADAAAKIDPLNVRRIVRALESYEISGMKFSETGEGVQSFGEPRIDVALVGLRYSRDVLRERITARVDAMFEAGWGEEVKLLLKNWEGLTAPARNAIGYGLIAEWINNGEQVGAFSELKEKIVNKTAQFSRRQRKWFERDPRITWIDCDDLKQSEIIERVKSVSSW